MGDVVGWVSGAAVAFGVTWAAPAMGQTPDAPPRSGRLVLQVPEGARPNDPIGAAGLGAFRHQFASVRPLVRRFGDPELAAETGLDRFYVVDLAPGVALEDLDPAMLRAHEASACLRPELGAQVPSPSSRGGPIGPSCTDYDEGFPDDGPGVQPVNDPLFMQQWSLRNTGQSVQGQTGDAGSDIDAPTAWSLVSNPVPIVVAVLDTGVSTTHPDLVPKLVPGFNAADGDATNTDDDFISHGTAAAGVIGAAANNEFGIVGVAGVSRIMPIRIFNRFGFGFETEFVAGLTYAADHGAQIASMSLGYPFTTDAMRAAVEYAHGRDVVLVASTGNVNGQAVQFPALMNQTIAVGATDNRDVLWPNSTRGPQISLVAPGVNVLTTWDLPSQPNAFKEQTGTSFAVPHVAGVAALVRAVNPDLDNEAVGWVLVNACEDLGAPGWDSLHGYGRINAAAAVALALAVGNEGCRTDFNGDGVFTLDDIEAFMMAFLAQDPLADLAAPFGGIDQNDLEAFVQEVLQGCSPDPAP